MKRRLVYTGKMQQFVHGANTFINTGTLSSSGSLVDVRVHLKSEDMSVHLFSFK